MHVADGDSTNDTCCTQALADICGIVHPGKAPTHKLTRPGKEPTHESTCPGKEPFYETTHLGKAPVNCTTNLLVAPRHGTGDPVTGATKEKLCLHKKGTQKDKQIQQHTRSYWQHHEGHVALPPSRPRPTTYRNEMALANLAPYHPAADLLLEYATKGCPTHTGKQWSIEEMEASIARGPHPLALQPDAVRQL
jgi:hypothetical protein